MEELASEYANRNFEHCHYTYTDDKRLTDFDKIKKAYTEGYEVAQPKWISAETHPNDERNVIIKIFDYRRPKENITEVGLGYFDHEEKEWYHTSDVLVNAGNGWMITHYMEIPQ